MKRKILLSFIVSMCFFLGSTYAQQLSFAYDAAGNQTTRTWVCVNCSGSSATTPVVTNINYLNNKATDSTAAKISRSIVASPNPLVETLKVDWKTEKGITVSHIRVYNTNGIKVHELAISPSQQSVQIPFLHLPSSVYILSVIFSDQRQENIKVIKR